MAKTILLAVLVAVLIAVTATLAQRLILGHSNAAVTGGVAGATAAVVVGMRRRKLS